MPLSAAALEKLWRDTMSQKIFRDFRFTGIRPQAAQKRQIRLIPDKKNE
jgi:hypothetical protein